MGLKTLYKNWRLYMNFDFSKLLDLVKAMVTPAEGSKFLLSALGMGAIVYMHKTAIASEWSDVTIGVVLVAYYIADSFKRKLQASIVKETQNANIPQG
jgi:hypothetical protein